MCEGMGGARTLRAALLAAGLALFGLAGASVASRSAGGVPGALPAPPGLPPPADSAPERDPAAGWTREGPGLLFVGKDLYGHIDGGAELFYELGFRDLRVERYARGGKTLVVERYRMESPESALGIYLAIGGGGEPVGAVCERGSGTRYQLCVLQGDLFVLVNNEAGDASFLPAMTALAARAIEGTEPGRAENVLALLPREHLVAGSERLIRGPYSLQAIVTLGEGDILLLGGEIFGTAGSYEGGEDSAWTLIRVPYPSSDGAREAFAHLVRNLDPYLEVVRSDPDRLLFRDFRGEYGAAYLMDQVLEVKVGLADMPK